MLFIMFITLSKLNYYKFERTVMQSKDKRHLFFLRKNAFVQHFGTKEEKEQSGCIMCVYLGNLKCSTCV